MLKKLCVATIFVSFKAYIPQEPYRKCDLISPPCYSYGRFQFRGTSLAKVSILTDATKILASHNQARGRWRDWQGGRLRLAPNLVSVRELLCLAIGGACSYNLQCYDRI